MMVAMPDGESDGIVLFRLSKMKEVLEGILSNWDNPEEEY